MNQCDGCRRQLPKNERGHHVEPSGHVYMGCTADRYAARYWTAACASVPTVLSYILAVVGDLNI